MTTNKEAICPRCNLPMGSIRTGLSRIDNKTIICADCATKEGVEQFLLQRAKSINGAR